LTISHPVIIAKRFVSFYSNYGFTAAWRTLPSTEDRTAVTIAVEQEYDW